MNQIAHAAGSSKRWHSPCPATIKRFAITLRKIKDRIQHFNLVEMREFILRNCNTKYFDRLLAAIYEAKFFF